jgi:hypothetical protein
LRQGTVSFSEQGVNRTGAFQDQQSLSVSTSVGESGNYAAGNFRRDRNDLTLLSEVSTGNALAERFTSAETASLSTTLGESGTLGADFQANVLDRAINDQVSTTASDAAGSSSGTTTLTPSTYDQVQGSLLTGAWAAARLRLDGWSGGGSGTRLTESDTGTDTGGGRDDATVQANTLTGSYSVTDTASGSDTATARESNQTLLDSQVERDSDGSTGQEYGNYLSGDLTRSRVSPRL